METILAELVLTALAVPAALLALSRILRRGRGNNLPQDFDFTHYKRIEQK
ncbi:MAG: hypothetical protein ACOZEN_10380 [Thermodesulfobacteriota bacterium]